MGGRYYWDRKCTVEEAYDLSISRLREMGMLRGHAETVITWTSSRTGKSSSIKLTVNTVNEPYAQLQYDLTGRDGNSRHFDYKVRLETTPCNFGGIRYWFACPSCHRRVAVIYLSPKGHYFQCRDCNNLSYRSRNRCRIESWGETSRQIEKLRGEIKRWTWRGRPTRKVRRLQALERKMGILSGPIMARLGKWEARLR
ncbi:MAG: hypothetical protein ACYTBP_08250 [Planctomycetota bacterium]|jgi:hypothetical protein